MKKKIISGVSIVIFIAIIIVVTIIINNKNDKKKEPYVVTIAQIERDSENNIKESNSISVTEEEKQKLSEYVNEINANSQSNRYSLILFTDFIVHVDENISIEVSSEIKEYVYFIDNTKEGSEQRIVTKAPEGFVDWVISKTNI